MPLISRNIRISLVAIGALVCTVIAWSVLGCPTSIDEAVFLRRVSSSASAGSQELKLAQLMPGDWELVCESHGYDGPLYLRRYERTYPPAAPSQDGVWGLIFIAKDGSYRSAVGSCGRVGANLTFEPHVCIDRPRAILVLAGNRTSCPTFSVRHG